jgi:hypothetical protein
MDISLGIIDIDETPDVATWNKKSQIKKMLQVPEPRPPPTTIGIGLRDKKQPKKDLIINPDNKKRGGSTLTVEANDLS